MNTITYRTIKSTGSVRAYSHCANGHEIGSTPITGRTERDDRKVAELASDTCGTVSCPTRKGA